MPIRMQPIVPLDTTRMAELNELLKQPQRPKGGPKPRITAYERRQIQQALRVSLPTRPRKVDESDRQRELRHSLSEGKYEAFLVNQAYERAAARGQVHPLNGIGESE